MRKCLRDDTFQWMAAAQSSFDMVKTHIVNSSALSIFDPSLPTIVSTDASDYGLRAKLTQMHPDNTERTVAFASRSLTPAERKYSIVNTPGGVSLCVGSRKVEDFLMGDKIYTAYRSPSPYHTATHKRTWASGNAYCLVVSQTPVLHV